jgi:hypothetical protein
VRLVADRQMNQRPPMTPAPREVDDWGRHAQAGKVGAEGLWNVNHVDEPFDEGSLDSHGCLCWSGLSHDHPSGAWAAGPT